ncbi:unnamed protein product [Sphagnum balticum]
MRKRVWVKEDCVVLIGMRSFDDEKADIIHCYLADEVRRLRAYGELPELQTNPDTNDGSDVTWDVDAHDDKQKVTIDAVNYVDNVDANESDANESDANESDAKESDAKASVNINDTNTIQEIDDL